MEVKVIGWALDGSLLLSFSPISPSDNDWLKAILAAIASGELVTTFEVPGKGMITFAL